MPLRRSLGLSGAASTTSWFSGSTVFQRLQKNRPKFSSLTQGGLLLRCGSLFSMTQVVPAMRLSQYPLNTVKETPAEAEVISHQLMLRAGLIRRLANGLYSWLPLGLRTLRKVERIIREEMDRSGALEVVMPVIDPAELWQESGRWSKYGPELLRFKD